MPYTDAAPAPPPRDAARAFLPRSLERAGFLSPEEKAAWRRVLDATDSAALRGADGGRAALKSALSCRVVYCSGFWRAAYATALYGVMYFSPLIMKAMFAESAPDASRVALLTSIPFVCGAAAHAANALHSSRTGERRAHIAAPWFLACVVMCTVPVALIYGRPLLGFTLFTLASTGINAADGPDVSWVTSLMSGRQRALGLAAVNMFAAVGGFIGGRPRPRARARARRACRWRRGGPACGLTPRCHSPPPAPTSKGPYAIGLLSTTTGSFVAPLFCGGHRRRGQLRRRRPPGPGLARRLGRRRGGARAAARERGGERHRQRRRRRRLGQGPRAAGQRARAGGSRAGRSSGGCGEGGVVGAARVI